jgi:hypothetical protein
LAGNSTTAQLKIQPPDLFNGKKKEKVAMWLFQVEQNFRAVNEFRDDRRVAYAASLLRKNAEVWWKDVVSQSESLGVDESICSWKEFKERITDAFKETNEEMKAREKLSSLVQRGSVADYKSLFITLTLDIPGLPEHEKKVQFHRGLKSQIKYLISINTKGNPYSYTLKEMMDVAENLDDTIFEEQKAERKASKESNGYVGKKKAGSASHRGGNPSNGLSGPTPMDIESVYHPPKLTPKEREKCRREGLCFACRQKGHTSANCPQYPKQDIPNGDRQ